MKPESSHTNSAANYLEIVLMIVRQVDTEWLRAFEVNTARELPELRRGR